jgi:hypothetical protein
VSNDQSIIGKVEIFDCCCVLAMKNETTTTNLHVLVPSTSTTNIHNQKEQQQEEDKQQECCYSWPKEEELLVDEDTKHLFELTTKKKRSEDEEEAIISLIYEKAPNVLEGLPTSSQYRIAQHCLTKVYHKNEVIFHQGDLQDAYNTVIYGAVSIYAKSSQQQNEKIGEHDKDSGRM